MFRSLQLFIAAAAVLVVIIGFAYLNDSQEPPELAYIRAHQEWSFTDFSEYFRGVAQEKGAEYAFDLLAQAHLPEGVDVHLLGHTVGNVLYAEQGIRGIRVCTHAFRNACSHAVVIGALLEHGEGALTEITKACHDAPGGPGAYTMCFHGLGHGVLAFTGYHLEQAVRMCERTGTSAYGQREYVECVGGVVMEMIDGVHDPDAWRAQVSTYFTDDPLYPCTASFMPKDVQGICYTYLTPRLFQVAGVDLSRLERAALAPALELCAPLAGDRPLHDACYGGFGKEFVALTQGRDIRDIGSMSLDDLTQVRAWCSAAPTKEGEAACNDHALASLFWGGENVPDASFAFCELVQGDAQDACYRALARHISYYLGTTLKGVALCERLPEAYRKFCTI